MFQLFTTLIFILLFKLNSTQSVTNILNENYVTDDINLTTDLPVVSSSIENNQTNDETINSNIKTSTSSIKNENSLTYDSLKNTNKFPLENAFKSVVYRLNVNSSSPCNYTGKERLSKCHKALIFDYTQYSDAIKETRNLILSRIGLKNEPNVNMNKNAIKLLSGINKNFDRTVKYESERQTLFDKHESHGKTVKLMREITEVVKCDQLDKSVLYKPVHNAVCLKFSSNDKLFSQKLIEKSYSSVYLWINLNIKEYSNKKHRQNASQTVIITNLRQEINFEFSIKNGWNSIDISDLIAKNVNQLNNEILFETFVIKCTKECLIELNNENDKPFGKMSVVYLSTLDSQRPLLQINNLVEDEKEEKSNTNKERSQRNKRDKVGNDNSENESAISYSKIEETNVVTNLCKNNIGHPNRECCLVSHYVSFNDLKWTNWIIQPLGYRANYCIGRCSTPKDFGNSTYNSEFKQRYNQFFAGKAFNVKNQLSSCCHPINLSSMTIKHYMKNGSIVTSVVPNMIVTACGCS